MGVRSIRLAVMAAVLATVPVALAMPSSAAVSTSAKEPNQCVVFVQETKASGEWVLGEEQCFDTPAEVRDRVSSESDVSSQRSSTLAIHCDLSGGGGACTTIVGSSCGGWLNVVPAWDNRYSSTIHGICSTIRHYVGASLSGTYQATIGGFGTTANLTSVNNLTSSVWYLP